MFSQNANNLRARAAAKRRKAVGIIVMVGERKVTKSGDTKVTLRLTKAGKALLAALRKQNAKRAKARKPQRVAFYDLTARFTAKGKKAGKRATIEAGAPAR